MFIEYFYATFKKISKISFLYFTVVFFGNKHFLCPIEKLILYLKTSKVIIY